MAALRCSLCAVNFPDPDEGPLTGHAVEAWPKGWPQDHGEPCPMCGEPVSSIQRGQPWDTEELHSLVNHALFERYLEETGRT